MVIKRHVKSQGPERLKIFPSRTASEGKPGPWGSLPSATLGEQLCTQRRLGQTLNQPQ